MILGVTTFSIETLSIVGLFLTISLNDTQHNDIAIILSVVFYTMSVFGLKIVVKDKHSSFSCRLLNNEEIFFITPAQLTSEDEMGGSKRNRPGQVL
jgi:hypothetical protein